jgi:GNAT superfamily N-acetyltransferase
VSRSGRAKSTPRQPRSGKRAELKVHPLTPERWKDVESLFGPRGACAGCWCMWWRLKRSDWSKGKGEGNRRALRTVVHRGDPPGLLAYLGSKPVGWIAIAPREAYPGLGRSRILKPLDEKPVWSVTCFFVARSFRRQGVTVELLKAAAGYARGRGAKMLEGYPSEPGSGSVADAWVFTGLAGAFRRAGFREAARPSPKRPIMRLALRAKRFGRSSKP